MNIKALILTILYIIIGIGIACLLATYQLFLQITLGISMIASILLLIKVIYDLVCESLD